MLRIGNTIFSLDILEKKFSCNLPVCMGNCCREGDAGAPLSGDEAIILKKIWNNVRPYLRSEGIDTIKKSGTSVRDIDGELVTPLIDGRECAYTITDGDIYLCGIEKAWAEEKVDFKKPLSCHLFPARVKKFTGITAVNYNVQPVCTAARAEGEERGTYVYEFLKEPLVRAFGKGVYDELCLAAQELRKSGQIS